MVKKIHKMVLGDRRLKVRELADMVNISKIEQRNVQEFNRGRSNLVYNIITGDETWIYSYEPESKQQSGIFKPLVKLNGHNADRIYFDTDCWQQFQNRMGLMNKYLQSET
ncbi:hypothetical protein ALC56_14436 [Trachymyrmex septentrionalis]|uniref:Mariner Mos1 transposase n=1 Tax=Trachymyrmex septentrionalis TaxID=34720 RepID=A0A195ETH4_9HYME|nr:hypothetical protein ALC56_14436 [Trachymyrmex septentrionalis]